MKYKYYALTYIQLGGKVFTSGNELPVGGDYKDLYDNGMVSREKIKDESFLSGRTSPVPLEIKVRRRGKRKNQSNR